ncbi:transcription termination factor, mitochondrial [Amyelois transitella]|uniref:transcription termination factor, mitochondrial n=1 Tax=Amyelois transitella TaxID=680683 RepID=UPI00067D4EBC|nr:transcription termination factor, mitochondrial [Amyelois transitella]
MFVKTLVKSLLLWKPRPLSLDINIFPVNKHLAINLLSLPFSTIKKAKESKDSHDYKHEIIKSLNFQSDKDACPFYKLPVKTLLHIYKVTENDEKNGFCINRLYYLAEKVKCPSWILSEKLAQRTFIYGLSFNWLSSSLEVLLENGVSGDRIIRDLWVLKYRSDTIRERLERVKSMGIDNLYPWMVRCSEDILNRYVNISQETKNILGDTKSTQVYLANRLEISPEKVEKICMRIPALKTIRVTKVKNFLDILIKEGFRVEDIAAKPRVLTSAPNTVLQRLKQLRELGLNEINLNVLCRSKKDFNKYVEALTSKDSSSSILH